MRRLGILFFYDKFGKVDKYLEFMLNDITKNFDKLIIVSNGKLLEEEKMKLVTFGEVIQRENKGFDVWAYKTGLEYLGWDRLNDFDEIVMFNNTIMGPVESFTPTFNKMDQNEGVDFWGITKYFEYKDGDPFGTIEYGYIPDHIQSHFISVRKSLFSSKEFHDYWENMKEIHNYEEAIGFHEAIFTKKFADLGYKWTTSVDMEELREFNNYPLLMAPKKMIMEFECPIFKKRSFFHDISDSLHNTTGEQASELYTYLKNSTSYDVEMIWPAILRGNHQYDIVKNLNLEYTLSTKHADIAGVIKKYQSQKVALIAHIYFGDLIKEMLGWISQVPRFFHVYIMTSNESNKIQIEEMFESLGFDKLEVKVVQNRGRDVGALLTGAKDFIMNYDVVCSIHDKKTTQVKPLSVGASFGYKCFENLLSNESFVYNVLETFDENPHLGLLTPPEPNHADFFPTLGQEWGPNFNVTKKLAGELGLTVPISEGKPPVAPLGTMFWFRPKAMLGLFAKDWEYEDFPPEPNNVDGTLLHAIERIYPFVIQNEGYYPAYIMSDKFSAIEFMNLHTYVRSMNLAIQSDNRYFDERVFAISHHGSITVTHFLKKVLWKLIGKENYLKLREKRARRV